MAKIVTKKMNGKKYFGILKICIVDSRLDSNKYHNIKILL